MSRSSLLSLSTSSTELHSLVLGLQTATATKLSSLNVTGLVAARDNVGLGLTFWSSRAQMYLETPETRCHTAAQ